MVVTPLAGWAALPAFGDPVALAAGIGVGDLVLGDPVRRRPARDDAAWPRSTYALMVSLLPATATVIGIVVLAQIPSVAELLGVALVVVGVAVHRERPRVAGASRKAASVPG